MDHNLDFDRQVDGQHTDEIAQRLNWHNENFGRNAEDEAVHSDDNPPRRQRQVILHTNDNELQRLEEEAAETARVIEDNYAAAIDFFPIQKIHTDVIIKVLPIIIYPTHWTT